MKKNKNRQQAKAPVKSDEKQGVSLADLLNSDIAEQLKSIKKEKEQEIEKQKQEEAAKREFERKQREKNKTFEELLNENPLDWKKFK